MLEILLEGLLVFTQPVNIAMAIVGTIFGIIFGALPGIGSPLTISLFLPVIFGVNPETGITFLLGLFNGSVYGGSITAILLNTPGTPGSVATCFDGYPLSRMGKASEALGASISASFVGGIISAIFLIVLLTPIAVLSLQFGPSQLFLIMILALGTVSQLASTNTLKALISTAFGILLGLIGFDLITGVTRMTFGIVSLGGGLNLIVTLIAFYAIAELMFLVQLKSRAIDVTAEDGALVPLSIRDTIKGVKRPFANMKNLLGSSVIGAILGAVPGVGVAVANFIAYSYAKMTSKTPENFGKGSFEGVVAPEAANNAVTATSLIPTLALGIPGGASAAVILGGMMILGIIPGPRLVESDPHIIGAIMIGFIVVNIVMLISGVSMTNIYQRVTRVPITYVVPMILAFSCFGAYVARNNMIDLILVALIGFIAYGMRKANYSIACMTLGFILAGMIEQYYHQSLKIAGDRGAMIFVTGQVNIAIIILGLLIFVAPQIVKYFRRWWALKKADSR